MMVKDFKIEVEISLWDLEAGIQVCILELRRCPRGQGEHIVLQG